MTELDDKATQDTAQFTKQTSEQNISLCQHTQWRPNAPTVTQNAPRKLSGIKTRKLEGGQNLSFFVSRKNKRIDMINKCVDVYV